MSKQTDKIISAYADGLFIGAAIGLIYWLWKLCAFFWLCYRYGGWLSLDYM